MRAKARGLSKRRWVADIIRKYAAHEWPQDCLALAGRFADFPMGVRCGIKPQGAVACLLIGSTEPIHRPEPRYQTMTAFAPFGFEYKTYEPLKSRSRSKYSRTKS